MTAYLAIVQRGRAGVYETLKERFEREPDGRSFQVLWDRRQGERRALEPPRSPDRRARDRRRPPPATWTALGFVLVPDPESQP